MGYEQFYRLQAEKKRYDQQQYQLKLQEEERLKMIQEAKTSGATELSDVEAGFRSGVSGIKQLGYGAVGLVGQALGEEGLQKWGVENYKKAEKEAEKYTVGRTTSLEDIKSLGDVVDWTEYNLGNLTPSMIESLGSAAIGAAIGTAAEPGVGTAAGAVAGFVAKDTTKKFLEKQVTKYIAKGLLKEEAEKMAEKALVRKIGSGTVMFANSYVQGMGDVYGETLDENGKGNVMASFLGAIPYAAVDTIADISILGRVVKGSAGENALKRYSKAFAKSGITGGAEETIQEADLILSGLLSGKSYSSEEVISRLGNSFAAAAVGGGALGILGGRKSSEKKAKYSLEDTLKIPYNQAQRTYEPTGSQIEGVKTPQEEKISVQSEGEKIISRTPQDSFSEYLQSLSPVENEVLGKMLQKEVPDDAVSNLNRDEIKAIRKALRIAKNIPGANTDVIQGNLDKITTIGEETGILQKRDISSIDTKQEFFEEKLQQKAEKDLQPAEVKIQQEKKYGDEIIEEKNIYTEHAANIYDDLIRFIDKKDKSLPTYIGTEKSITAESLQQVADSMVKNTVPSEKTARMVYARVKNELTKRISGISKKENISKVKNKTVIKKEKEVKKSEPKNKIPKEYFKTAEGSAVREELSQAMPGERIYIPSNEPGKNFDVVRNPSSFPKYIGSEKSHRTTKVLQRVLDAIANDTVPSDMMAQRVYNRVHNEILSRMGKEQKSFPAETRKNAKKVAEKQKVKEVKSEKKSTKKISEKKVEQKIAEVEEPTSYYIGKDFDIDGYAKRRDQYEKEITALEKVADMKMREGSKSISKQKLSIVERAKQMTLLRSEIYSKLDKDIDSVQKRYFGTSNLFYFDNDKKKPIVLPKDKVSAQKAKQALEAASKSPMMHDFAVLQEVAKTFDTEVNPVLKASLHVDILRKILTKEGKASGALGTYNPNNYGISISTEDGPEKAVEVIRHEVLHHAYNLLPIEDKKVVLKWYKSLSREQLDQIYGVDKEGSLYDRYHERYKGREASLADETFSHFFSNNVGFIKDTTTENYLLRAYKNAIRKVMWYLRRIRNYVAGERVVRDIYQSVFSQVGGRRFIIDMEKMDRLASQGVEMGKVKFSDFTKLQDGTMLFEKKNGVLTEKGRLDYRKALQSGWKKLYGENPPRKIVNMFERNDIELFRASARISFTGGMERQADLNKNMEEFQKAASIFVEENLPENLRGKFIDRILNAKDDKSFQRVMEDVDKENAAEDARDLKRFEKRLSDENKLKVKMDNLKESHRASILKKNEQILKIREDNISKIKEVRSRLTKMFKERIATGEQVRATAAEYVIASLPKRERSAFLKAIAKAKTEKGLRKIMERVDSKRSAYERRFLVNNIQELTKNIGKLPVDIQRSIIDITANLELKNHTQKFLDKLQKTKEYLDRQGTDMDMPRRVLNQLGILERTPLKNITTDQLAQINNTLKQYVNVGKNIMSNRQATMVYETNRAVGLLKNASRNLDVIDVSRKENILMEKEIGKAELAKEWLRRKRLGFLFIDRLFNKIDGTSDYSGLNHKMLKEPIDNAWNSWQIAMDRYLQTFWKTVNDYKLGEDSSRRIATWAYLQQKDGKRKLLEGGTYTEEQLRDFKLTEDEMTVYEMMREMLEEIHPRLKEYMANQHNVDLGYRENFFPMMTDYTVTKPLVDDLMAEATLKNIPFGSIKERKEGANQRLKMDAFAIFQSYVGKATYFMAMDPEITRIRKIVENEQYRKAVGELASREIMNWLNVLVRKGGPVAKEQPWQKAVTKLNNNLSFAILGWRIVTILKQPIAILNGAAELGSWAFKGIPMVINEEYRGFMDLHSSEMRNRSGGDIAYTELAENKKLAIIQEKSMKPTQFVDRYTAGAVWMGAYHKKLSELGEKFDIDKPNNDAIRYADLIVRITQSTGTFKDIGSALTGEDRFANKLLFKFQSFVLNNWNYISEDIPNNFSKDKTVAARQIAFLSLAMLTEAAVGTASKQIFQQAVRGGEDDDNDESLLISSLKSIITSTITAVPYIGQIANTIMYGSTNPVPLISFIEKSLTSVRQVKNAKKMDTRQRHMIRIAAYTIGVIYGIPTDQARIMLEKALFGDKNKSKL